MYALKTHVDFKKNVYEDKNCCLNLHAVFLAVNFSVIFG